MKTRLVLTVLFLFSLITLSGCANQLTRSSSSASVGKIIEPVRDSLVASDRKPLTFPVTVAIVAVPGKHAAGGQVPNTTLRLAAEKLKQQLLANARFVSSVVLVDQDDVKESVSLERIRSAYAADIAVVLSFQQDQRSSQRGLFGLADATVVGMFLVPGVQITTSSIIDGKVIHIPSNSVVFRTSGKDERTSHSTTYAVNASLTEQSIDSIQAAAGEFGKSVNQAVARFDKFDLSRAVPLSAPAPAADQNGAEKGSEEKGVEAGNDYWNSVNSYKRTGGGAFGLAPLLIAAAACCAAWRRK